MTIAVEKQRIISIDVIRGLVMLLMALDHVRDYFHIDANTIDPLDPNVTNPFLYFTRWVTHFCAPTFVFLSGTSIYLQSLRKSANELAIFLITRGIWLILAEVSIVTFGWTFDLNFRLMVFAVIWAIGISMLLLGLLVFLRTPYTILLILVALIVGGHNLLDYAEQSPAFETTLLKDLIHHGGFNVYPLFANHSLLVIYPFLPWFGLMLLGYCLGKIFTPTYSFEKRRSILIKSGISCIMLFVLIRLSNLYGNPTPWVHQDSLMNSIYSFLNVSKYPPSLLYSFMTIGPMLLLLAWIEKVQNRFTDIMNVFGRTAFFYYILHIYLIHFLATISFLAKGHSLNEELPDKLSTPFNFVVVGEGYLLPVVYLIWITVLIILYPLCKWYDGYKSRNKQKKWLSYI